MLGQSVILKFYFTTLKKQWNHIQFDLCWAEFVATANHRHKIYIFFVWSDIRRADYAV
jgi:hypothetical protein